MAEQTETTSRRNFLQSAGTAAATGALIFGDWGSRAEAASLRTRTLGRTGMKVTELTFGAIQLKDASHQRLLDQAIDRGVNLIHVSPSYTNGQAIKVVGAVLKSKRAKVLIALKASPTDGKFDSYLRALNTDHVDILVPPVSKPSQMDDARMRDAFGALKKAGKIRASGFAVHEDMANVLRAGIKGQFWDTCLLRYNLPAKAELDPVVDAAAKYQKMGFMVMKAAQGLNRSSAGDFGAGLKKLLGNPNIHTLTLGMATTQELERNLASLQRSSLHYLGIDPLAASCTADLCSGCGQCQAACPRGVAVNDYLRAGLYRRRGDVNLAEELLASIPPARSAAVCHGCGLCTGVCQQGIDVVAEIRGI